MMMKNLLMTEKKSQVQTSVQNKTNKHEIDITQVGNLSFIVNLFS